MWELGTMSVVWNNEWKVLALAGVIFFTVFSGWLGFVLSTVFRDVHFGEWEFSSE